MVDGVVGVVRKALEPTAGGQLVNTSPDLTSRGMLTVIVGTIFEYIAGLAVESLTDGFEGGEAYGFGLARLEYRDFLKKPSIILPTNPISCSII